MAWSVTSSFVPTARTARPPSRFFVHEAHHERVLRSLISSSSARRRRRALRGIGAVGVGARVEAAVGRRLDEHVRPAPPRRAAKRRSFAGSATNARASSPGFTPGSIGFASATREVECAITGDQREDPWLRTEQHVVHPVNIGSNAGRAPRAPRIPRLEAAVGDRARHDGLRLRVLHHVGIASGSRDARAVDEQPLAVRERVDRRCAPSRRSPRGRPTASSAPSRRYGSRAPHAEPRRGGTCARRRASPTRPRRRRAPASGARAGGGERGVRRGHAGAQAPRRHPRSTTSPTHRARRRPAAASKASAPPFARSPATRRRDVTLRPRRSRLPARRRTRAPSPAVLALALDEVVDARRRSPCR